MGFEQLAGLRAKLAEQAKKEAREKAPRQPAPAAKPNKPSRPNKPGAKPGAKPAAKPSGQAAQQARPATPVDPVVRNIGKLQKKFPLAFPKNPAPKVPLKIGIFDDLLTHATELGLSEAELREAIRTWCRGARYWTCLTQGAPRLDLAGQPAGEVTEADAARGRQLRSARPKQKPAQPKPAAQQAAQPAASQAEAQAAPQPEAAAADTPAGSPAVTPDVTPATPETPSQPE
ncbi:Activator of osmoprotectant transporter ProP [Cupriavidus sp. U2]|uniref:ProQ/FinO family protein n=1 Tax=Cupriavidus sp. U2 TaxID=2920269 RepID=UPI00129D7B08|nr:ProQ/FinO family protein [Cupriavidus sp. U2]KAI3591209.1 Activator of osmoprotectant transporter ProP [Cupriavidus sp. U2]